MEVKLTAKQKEILGALQSEKASLQKSFIDVTKRENDLIVMLAESSGYSITPATTVTPKEGDVLVFAEPEAKEVKLKSSKNSKG